MTQASLTEAELNKPIGQPLLKGTGVRGLVRFAGTRYPAEWQAAIARVSPEARRFIEGPITPAAWHPNKYVVEVLAALDDVFPKGFQAIAVEMGREVLHDDMTTIHRAFLRYASPHLMLKIFSVLWGLYRRDGALEVTRQGPHSAVCLVRNVGIPCRLSMRSAVGATVGILEIVGAKNIKHRLLTGGGRNDCFCSWELTWA